MIKKLVPVGILGLAGTVTLGVIAMTGATTANAAGHDDDAYVKREDNVTDLALVSDDDDDDTGTRTRTRSGAGDDTTAGTGSSRSRADGTSSRYTAMSRDRDHSRGDRTKDWTQDGPGTRTRDFSQNRTNDWSRHDTR